MLNAKKRQFATYRLLGPAADVCGPPVADIRLFGQNRRMTLPRVFFDANDGTMEHGYWLGFDRSLKDLRVLGVELREGTRVTICMPHELEMTATLRFDATQKVWWAKPVDGTIKYLDGSA